jgi:hypothetical protein
MRWLQRAVKGVIIFLALCILIYLISDKGVLNFLNSNSGSFNVLFAFVVAIATSVYALLTRTLVSETKKHRRFTQLPLVFLESNEKIYKEVCYMSDI